MSSKTIIEKIPYEKWSEFSKALGPGPCRSMAFPQGEAYAIFLNTLKRPMVGMVWYTYAYRNNQWRKNAIPILQYLNQKQQIAYLNNNVRLLARISVFEEYRHHRYAQKLLARTIRKIGVQYVECLTAHDDIRSLLDKCGFILYDENLEQNLSYYLWTR